MNGSQFARWNPFDGTTSAAAPHMNGNPIKEKEPGSTEPNHSCSQGRSKGSPGSDEKRNGWKDAFQKCGEEEHRNGWASQFTNLAKNGDLPSSDHRPSNGGNILMVSQEHFGSIQTTLIIVNPDNTRLRAFPQYNGTIVMMKYCWR